MNKLKNFLGLLIITIVYSLLFIHLNVYAINMNSPLYKIQYGEIGIAGSKKSSESYKISDTLGQLAAGEFQSTGYIVKAGFQYLHSIIPFRFSISNININFGTVIPNTPSTATTTLTVSFGGAGSYQVTATELGPMTSLSGSNTIPDTSCDGGANTCTENLAKPWTLNSAYGFGYNMSGDDIPSDFVNSTYYRPFADKNEGESPATVMSSTNVGKNRQATLTFKVNVSPVQPAATYQTVINFVATPSF